MNINENPSVQSFILGKVNYNSEMLNWGLLYIADYINRSGHEAYILVAKTLDELKEKIRDKINAVELIGISLMTPSIANFLDLISFVKKDLNKKIRRLLQEECTRPSCQSKR